jgi:hypothetical protein
MGQRRSVSIQLAEFVRAQRRSRSEVQRQFWPDSVPNGIVLSLLCELGIVDDDTHLDRSTARSMRARIASLEAENQRLRQRDLPK